MFGIYAPHEQVARLTFFGLFALQHRGQESAGIAVSDGQRASLYKEMGLVSQVFNEDNLRPLTGHIAIGHTRYSTADSSRPVSAQPFLLESMLGPIAIAHNGNLVNTDELRQRLFERGVGLTSWCAWILIRCSPRAARRSTAFDVMSIDGAFRTSSRGALCRPRSLGFSASVVGQLNGSGWWWRRDLRAAGAGRP